MSYKCDKCKAPSFIGEKMNKIISIKIPRRYYNYIFGSKSDRNNKLMVFKERNEKKLQELKENGWYILKEWVSEGWEIGKEDKICSSCKDKI
jgi:hypothetical protein